MLKSRKKLALILLAGTSYLASFSGMVQAQANTPTLQVPKAPLLPTDPRAILDPALVNVPDVSAPQSSRSQTRTNSSTSNSAISYDLATGKVQLGGSLSATTTRASSLISPPSPGSSTNVVAEPRTDVQSSAGGAKPRSVIGTDSRTRVTNTTAYPWRTVTKLFVTFPKSNSPSGCSGTLIAAQYVLTAGHCVYNKASGGYAKKIEVIPGLSGTYKPYGSAYAKKIRAYTAWTSSQNSNYDFALITLDRPIGNSTGWLGYTTYSSVNGITGNIAGYPGDKGGTYLYYHSGRISSSTSYRLYYQIDTYGGQSGSGIYYIDSQNNRYIFGVHTTGVTPSSPSYNSGTRIDAEKYNYITSAIASGT